MCIIRHIIQKKYKLLCSSCSWLVQTENVKFIIKYNFYLEKVSIFLWWQKDCHLLLILFAELPNSSSYFTNNSYLFHNVIVKNNVKSQNSSPLPTKVAPHQSSWWVLSSFGNCTSRLLWILFACKKSHSNYLQAKGRALHLGWTR